MVLISDSFSPSAGYTAMESPLCTPALSMCSMIPGTPQDGIVGLLSDTPRFFEGSSCAAWGLGDAQTIEEIFEAATILSHIYGAGARSNYGHSAASQWFAQVDRCLPTKLQNRWCALIAARPIYNSSIDVHRILILQDVPHTLLIQCLEVKAVAGIEVSRDSLWIGVH